MTLSLRKPPKLAIPEHAHPLVKFLYTEMQSQQIGVVEMATRSGVNKNTLKDWRTRTAPTLDNLDACLSVLGFRLSAKVVE